MGVIFCRERNYILAGNKPKNPIFDYPKVLRGRISLPEVKSGNKSLPKVTIAGFIFICIFRVFLLGLISPSP
jgi:hypothetical protein